MIIGHKRQWEFLKNKFESNQLSHAYLFVGPEGIGKKLVAKELTELIGCKFPDLMIVQEANKKDYKFGDGGEITIAQIRKVQGFLSYKSYNGGFKIVIVDDAEKMNQEAQSCFLKTLEEPRGSTLIILISSKPYALLPTIISRCQTIKFSKPKGLPENPEKLKREQEILKELIPAMSSNLAAKFKYTKAIDFEKQNVGEILEVMQKHLREMLLSDSKKYSPEKLKQIINLTEDVSQKLFFTNANPKLALEILLMEM